MPTHTPRFVINTILEPGKPVEVFVTNTKGALEDGTFSPVRDAKVEIIEEGGKSHTLVFRSLSNDNIHHTGYTSDELEIEAGKTYEVIASGRFPTANAKVTVPLPVEVKSFTIQPGSQGKVEFEVVFDDPEEESFYEIMLDSRGYMLSHGAFGSDTVRWSGNINIAPLNPIYKKDYYNRGNLLINDMLFNGREARVGMEGILLNRSEEMEVTIYLKRVTEAYYNYHHTIGMQRYTEYDPFAQPVQLYNNVENGRGVVMAGATANYVIKVEN